MRKLNYQAHGTVVGKGVPILVKVAKVDEPNNAVV